MVEMLINFLHIDDNCTLAPEYKTRVTCPLQQSVVPGE
jgi:hypothetical protein